MPRKAPKKRKAYDDPHFNKLALVIGHICINWSRVEDVMDFLISRMILLEEGSNLANAITSNMDIRNKIQTLKALVYERRTGNAWFKEYAQLLDQIDNELRPARNRYVHSHWFRPDGRLTRVSRRVRFSKPQAFKELALTTEERDRASLRDAQRLCSALENAWTSLFFLSLPKYGGPALPPTPEQQSPDQGAP
ncbi:hypothetical protein UNPF46_29000 [Bradyrhizobium sp. UNPF46]|uniref:hypothetical protein n=1 Tax=Bradyrhizobium sp. UNPF46 TaxID=1141168 RepID=UPI00114E2F9F|nr:hypothetical protein [Bradyrhizobium sp. UNPF46]TQF27805.1 hypothetical protein UNPF46_29000 [Bradyrhizobium sp. UNPF46]